MQKPHFKFGRRVVLVNFQTCLPETFDIYYDQFNHWFYSRVV